MVKRLTLFMLRSGFQGPEMETWVRLRTQEEST